MFKPGTFFLKIFQGTAMLTLCILTPIIAHALTRNGAIVFIAWLVQLVIIAVAMFLLRGKIKNWVWLIIVSSAPIILMPVIASHISFLALGILPIKMAELTKEALPVLRPRINTVLIAAGARVDTLAEIRYTITEAYEVEDQNRPGHYQDKTSTTEYRFVPVFWANEEDGRAFGLIEYNGQVKESFKSGTYINRDVDSARMPTLYLIPGMYGLKKEAALTFRQVHPSPRFELVQNHLVFSNAFTSEGEMRSFIRAKRPLPIVFYLILLTGFVIIPAVVIARKRE